MIRCSKNIHTLIKAGTYVVPDETGWGGKGPMSSSCLPMCISIVHWQPHLMVVMPGQAKLAKH
jgi:hypothetical protein